MLGTVDAPVKQKVDEEKEEEDANRELAHGNLPEFMQEILDGFIGDDEAIRDDALDWIEQIEREEKDESSEIEWHESQRLVGLCRVDDVLLPVFGDFFMFLWRRICDAHSDECEKLQDEEAQKKEKDSCRGFPTLEEPDDEDAKENAKVNRRVSCVLDCHPDEERCEEELEHRMITLKEVDGEHAEEEGSD